MTRTSSEPASASSRHCFAVAADVGRVGRRHRLDDDGRPAADRHLSDLHRHRLVAPALVVTGDLPRGPPARAGTLAEGPVSLSAAGDARDHAGRRPPGPGPRSARSPSRRLPRERQRRPRAARTTRAWATVTSAPASEEDAHARRGVGGEHLAAPPGAPGARAAARPSPGAPRTPRRPGRRPGLGLGGGGRLGERRALGGRQRRGGGLVVVDGPARGRRAPRRT